MIKTSVSVFISIMLYLILLWIDDLCGVSHSDFSSPSNMYTPFFAAIAAVYAAHNIPSKSIEQAKIRSIGSIVGGYFGMAVLLFGDYLIKDVLGVTEIIVEKAIYFTIVSLCLIILIKVTVLIKVTPATFISSLTFLSVTISIRNGGMPAFQFATNRIISTLVGVGIALMVNHFEMILPRNKNVMFVTSLENSLVKDNHISDHMTYQLNSLYYLDMNLLFATERTLCSIGVIFNNVHVNKPMVVMNGSAVYDFETKEYSNVIHISNEARYKLEEVFNRLDMHPFTFSICDNDLHSYHDKPTNQGQIEYLEKRKHGHYNSFVRGKCPDDLDVTLYIVIDLAGKINKLGLEINNLNLKDEIDVVIAPYHTEGHSILKINARSARKEYEIQTLFEKYNCNKLVVCGSGMTDIPLMSKADLSICLSSAPQRVKDYADYVIENDNPEEVVKLFGSLYHSINIDKRINKIKKIK